MIDIPIGPHIAVTGGFVLSWHGLFSFAAVAIAVFLVGRWAPARGVSPDDIYSIAVWAILGGIIGARIVHVVDNLNVYQADPARVFAIWTGGIGLWGGILGGFLAGAAYALIRKHPVGVIADLAAPAILLAQTIGRVGDIVNGEHCARAWDFALGFIWSNPDADARWCGATGVGVSVHPVIAYEMVWNMLALVLIWNLRNRLRPDGMLFALYLALYSLGRFAVTFLREDKIWALGMQEAQYIALLVLAITVPLLIIKARPRPAEEAAAILDGAEIVERGTRAERRRRRARG